MINQKATVEDDSMQYLAEKAPPAQLSEMYHWSVERPVSVSSALEKAANIPLARSEQDERLLQKYPIIYKRIFNALKDSFSEGAQGLSVRAVSEKIDRTARSAVIEEILDNVSWALAVKENYVFSVEVVDHSVVINESDDQNTETVSGDETICTIDFCGSFDLAYTRPEGFSYFGEKKECGNSWATLYVNIMAAVIKDYPYMFKSGMSFSKTGGRVELANNTDYGFMFAPKPVPGTDYMLETNISASDIAKKVKYILDICSVDYENVVITYSKNIPKTAPVEPASEPAAAYRNRAYEEVLKQYFKKGFRMGSPLEIRKFKRYYTAIHNAELTDSDEDISGNIKMLCVVYDGKAFLPDIMLSEELKKELFEYIDDAFANGKTAIYYQAIYTEFSEAFLDYHIHDADMLKSYLMFVGNGRFYINRSFISKEPNVILDPLSEIRSCLQGYGRPVEYNELFRLLPHLPQSKIKFILANNGEFINNGHGAYFHESIVRLSEGELDGIADIIQQTIDEKDFICGNELYDAIKAKYPYIIEDHHALSVYGFRDLLKAKLGDMFSFKGNIISEYGQELSMADVFAKYARSHDSFTLAELQGLANNLATVIYFESVYENSLRISRDQFVSKREAQFSIPDTDEAIDRVCTGKYVSIQEVTNFGIFPYAGFTWNSFLLEHYVAYYSQKYMLLHSGFNGTECVGAIVKRSAGISSFNDLIVDLLVDSPVEMKDAPVLQFLSDEGYIARRRYSKIESLIIKANAQRQRKDKD